MAEKKRRRTRVRSTITELPEDIRKELDQRLMDTRYSFVELSDWLKELGHEISKSAIGRYYVHVSEAAERVAETLRQTEAIIQAVENTPDADYTKASRIMMMDGLLKKVSMAEEEFLEMPLDKAGRLIASLSRAEIYSQKARFDFKTKTDLAFEAMEADILREIRDDPDLSPKLQEILRQAKEKLIADE